METNLYTITVPVMMKALGALDKILDKLVAHAETKATERQPVGVRAEALLQSRLVFDQFPFIAQVRIATDNAKGCAARLAEVGITKFEDNEKTVSELKERIAKTLAFLKTIKPEQIIGKENIKISLPHWNGKYVTGFEYVTEQALPNFFFHVTTAYAILRHNGVVLGKSDYIGGLPLKD